MTATLCCRRTDEVNGLELKGCFGLKKLRFKNTPHRQPQKIVNQGTLPWLLIATYLRLTKCLIICQEKGDGKS